MNDFGQMGEYVIFLPTFLPVYRQVRQNIGKGNINICDKFREYYKKLFNLSVILIFLRDKKSF
jgi:hypothetical protein